MDTSTKQDLANVYSQFGKCCGQISTGRVLKLLQAGPGGFHWKQMRGVKWSTFKEISNNSKGEIVLRGRMGYRLSKTNAVFFVLINLDGEESLCCKISENNKQLKLFVEDLGKNSMIDVQGIVQDSDGSTPFLSCCSRGEIIIEVHKLFVLSRPTKKSDNLERLEETLLDVKKNICEVKVELQKYFLNQLIAKNSRRTFVRRGDEITQLASSIAALNSNKSSRAIIVRSKQDEVTMAILPAPLEDQASFNLMMETVDDILRKLLDHLCLIDEKKVKLINDWFPFKKLEYNSCSDSSGSTLKLPFVEAMKMLEGHELTFDEHVEKKLGNMILSRYGTDYYFLHTFPKSLRRKYAMAEGDSYSRSFAVYLRGSRVAFGCDIMKNSDLIAAITSQKKVVEHSCDSCPHGLVKIQFRRIVAQYLDLDDVVVASLGKMDPNYIPIWERPPQNWIKVNTDASAHDEDGEAGLGMAARNCDGAIIYLAGIRVPCRTTMIAEAQALEWATSLAEFFGWENVIYSSDSLGLVEMVNAVGHAKTEASVEVKAMRNKFITRNWVLKWSPREKNCVADFAARLAYTNGNFNSIDDPALHECTELVKQVAEESEGY